MSPRYKISIHWIQTYIPMGKTFRKIRVNGNFKRFNFVGLQQPLKVFKPPVNETFTHNNPNIQPSNYSQTNINPMNYNFNQQHQYDDAEKIN